MASSQKYHHRITKSSETKAWLSMGTMEILHSYNLNINLHLNLYIEEIDWYKIVIQF